MIISITSPRKNQGQTTTAINLAAILVSEFNKKVLLVDTNRFCRDVSFYLSSATMPKGFDNFINSYETGKSTEKSLFDSVEETKYGVSIMNSPMHFEMKIEYINALIELAKDKYDCIIFDLDGPIKDEVMSLSDHVVIVINPNKRILSDLDTRYANYLDKVHLVVNRYAEKINGVKQKCTLKSGCVELQIEINNEIFPLELDGDLTNACNESRLLHYVSAYKKRPYVKAIKKLANRMCGE